MKTEEKKVVTISESNRFYKARKEIGKISRERNVDIGVALDMYIQETKQTGHTAEKEEFLTYTTHLQRISTKADNRIVRFFGEE